MGTKARPQNPKTSQRHADSDVVGVRDGDAGLRTLMTRIADALQIPTGDLYVQSDDARQRDGGSTTPDAAALDAECAVLTEAYRRIPDPLDRHQLLTLVQMAARADR